MIRMSAERFLKNYYGSKVHAVRIKNGEFYFLAWIDNKNQLIVTRNPIQLERDIVMCLPILEAAALNDAWDQEVQNVRAEGKRDAHEKILSCVKPYERNGVSDKGDYDIFRMNIEEWHALCDALRDGDYLLVIDDENA